MVRSMKLKCLLYSESLCLNEMDKNGGFYVFRGGLQVSSVSSKNPARCAKNHHSGFAWWELIVYVCSV